MLIFSDCIPVSKLLFFTFFIFEVGESVLKEASLNINLCQRNPKLVAYNFPFFCLFVKKKEHQTHQSKRPTSVVSLSFNKFALTECFLIISLVCKEFIVDFLLKMRPAEVEK